MTKKYDDKPLIATIIPTYKRPKQLKKAIESVLAQTFASFAVFVYDNNSGDETEEIVRQLQKKDPRVHYFCHPENIGAVANFHFGLEKVTSPFFSFLSDDDLLLPSFYETALSQFDHHPQAGFVCSAVVQATKEGRVIHVATQGWGAQDYYTPPDGLFAMISNHVEWMGVLFRKEVRDQIGNIDTEIKAIDVDFLYRAASQFPFAIIKKACGIFFQHATSYSYYSSLKVVWPSWLKMSANLQKRVSPSLLPRVEEAMQRDLIRKLLFAFVHSLKIGQFVLCREAALIMDTHCKKHLLARVMRSCTWFLEQVPFCHSLLSLLLRIRRLLLKNKWGLQRKFGPLVPSQ